MKKKTRNIIINQQTPTKEGINPINVVVKTKRLISTEEGAPALSEVLGALILVEKIIKDLTDNYDNLMDQLKATGEEEICRRLVAEGVLEEGETPIITVIDRGGGSTSKIVCDTTRQTLNIDGLKDLARDPATFAAMPAELKKEGLQTSSEIKKLFDAGKIDEAYLPYMYTSSTTITGFKTTKI